MLQQSILSLWIWDCACAGAPESSIRVSHNACVGKGLRMCPAPGDIWIIMRGARIRVRLSLQILVYLIVVRLLFTSSLQTAVLHQPCLSLSGPIPELKHHCMWSYKHSCTKYYLQVLMALSLCTLVSVMKPKWSKLLCVCVHFSAVVCFVCSIVRK